MICVVQIEVRSTKLQDQQAAFEATGTVVRAGPIRSQPTAAAGCQRTQRGVKFINTGQ